MKCHEPFMSCLQVYSAEFFAEFLQSTINAYHILDSKFGWKNIEFAEFTFFHQHFPLCASKVVNHYSVYTTGYNLRLNCIRIPAVINTMYMPTIWVYMYM